MITQQTYSSLALHVYAAKEEFNKPKLPTGWTDVTLANSPLIGTYGFAYAVYKGPGNEIVISYRGTDDLLSADMLTNLGLNLSQERQAAEVYARVLQDNPGSNITFTGHSLGGGLAGAHDRVCTTELRSRRPCLQTMRRRWHGCLRRTAFEVNQIETQFTANVVNLN